MTKDTLDDENTEFELMDLSVDIQARDNGAWIKKNKTAPGLVLRACGLDSPKLMALEIALTKDRPEGYGEDDLVTLERNMYENRKKAALAIVDWEPFRLRGELVKFSKATLKKLLNDRTFDRFLYACVNAMQQADRVTVKWEADAEKNLEAGSKGNAQSGQTEAAV